MNVLVPHADLTRDADLQSWEAFCLAYHEPIRRALRIIGLSEIDSEELTQAFLVKAAEKRFLAAFNAFREREAEQGRHARFRNYLYRSLVHQVCDLKRKGHLEAKMQMLGDGEAEQIEGRPERLLDPDAIYAIDVLHQSLQALRTHCERSGKAHIWVVFEELVLADEFRGRNAATRAELLQRLGIDSPQSLNNCLTTAKRAFRRFVMDVISEWPAEGQTGPARFAEWVEVLRDSSASRFNLLQIAYSVAPFLSEDASHALSAALMVEESPGAGYNGLGTGISDGEADDDELKILLSFRLELPLTRMLDISELTQLIPKFGLLSERFRDRAADGLEPKRSLCLLSLFEPTEAEAKGLAATDVAALLSRMKLWAKQLHNRTDHAIPRIFAELIYTLVIVAALVRCQRVIYSIKTESLVSNIRWFLAQNWIDSRVRPLLNDGLSILEKQLSC